MRLHLQTIASDGLLSFAATPAFAIMALLTGILGGDGSNMLCMSTHAAWLGGMVPMYLLMSAFHLAPWLKWIAIRRGSKVPATGEST